MERRRPPPSRRRAATKMTVISRATNGTLATRPGGRTPGSPSRSASTDETADR